MRFPLVPAILSVAPRGMEKELIPFDTPKLFTVFKEVGMDALLELVEKAVINPGAHFFRKTIGFKPPGTTSIIR